MSKLFGSCVLKCLVAASAVTIMCCVNIAMAQESSSQPQVEITQGTLVGVIRDNVEDFFGIPYAAPPVSNLRFAAPASADGWDGERDASTYGSACPQVSGLDSDRTIDEDCLYVNVQRPVGTSDSDQLPVLVLLHGGGLVTGSGNNEDLDALVSENNIIGVSVNYRLGSLGYLALPQDANNNADAVANWGFLDQQAALRWIKENIAAFGGDPEQITIGGESAGGMSVCAHLASPSSENLFTRAFMMSTYCFAMPLANARETTSAILNELDCPVEGNDALACLRDKSVDDFLDADTVMRRAVSNTAFLPRPPFDVLMANEIPDVPMMIGWMRDEGRSFQTNWATTSAKTYDETQYRAYVKEAFPDDAADILKVYPWPDNPTRYTGTYLVANIAIQNLVPGPAGLSPCKSLNMTDQLSSQSDVWVYEVANSDASGWFDIPGYVWGAGHATELPYLIPNRGNKALNANAFGDDERTLATEMRARWGAFVVGGNPNAEAFNEWPAYNSEDGPVLSFEGGEGSNLVSSLAVKEAHECTLWNRVLAE